MPRSFAKNEIVEKLPVFFAAYGLPGVGTGIGRILTVFLLLLPTDVTALLPIQFPYLLRADGLFQASFFAFTAAAFFVSLVSYRESSRVFET